MLKKVRAVLFLGLTMMILGCDERGGLTIPPPNPVNNIKSRVYANITLYGVHPSKIPLTIVDENITGAPYFTVETTDPRITILCEFANGMSGSEVILEIDGNDPVTLGGLSHKELRKDCKDVKSVRAIVTRIEYMRNMVQLKPSFESPVVPDGFVPINNPSIEFTTSLKPEAEDFKNWRVEGGAPIAQCIVWGDVFNHCTYGAITTWDDNKKKLFIGFAHSGIGLGGPVFDAVVTGQQSYTMPGSAQQIMWLGVNQQGCVAEDTNWGIWIDSHKKDCFETEVETVFIDLATPSVINKFSHKMIKKKDWPSFVTTSMIASVEHVIRSYDNYSLFEVSVGLLFSDGSQSEPIHKSFCGIQEVYKLQDSIAEFLYGQPKKVMVTITRNLSPICSVSG